MDDVTDTPHPDPFRTTSPGVDVTRNRKTGLNPFAVSLRAAMQVRGLNGKQLAAAVGNAETNVSALRLGKCIPTLGTARRMAEVLDWAQLVTIAVTLRTKTCEVCRASFVDASRNVNARCCSVECQRTRHGRKVRGVVTTTLRGRAEVAENRLELYQHSVDRMCRQCAPEGECWDGACPLRRVSPLALASRKAA